MSQQIITIGAAPNDGSGDQLRLSFNKCNDNFTELYAKAVTEGLWNYNKTSADTSTSPVSGRFRTNSGNYRDATQIAIHAITIQGIDRTSTLRALLVGDSIQCQDSTNSAAWCRYSLQSLPVDHGTWFQLNVTFQTDGGVASGDNQEIVFVFTANSGAAAGGNVSNSGTPTVGQYAKWVTATTIQGVAPATVLSDIGAQPAGSYQPLDGDLTAIAALAGTNTIYYRSAANTWSPVVVSTGLAFSGGNLTATAAGGNVSNSGTPTAGQIAQWIDATHIRGVAAPFGSPQGRLTIDPAAAPVMTSTFAGQTTINYVPYVGDRVPIYNGTSWVMIPLTSGGGYISIGTTDTTRNPSAIGASKVNDWYVWDGGAGFLYLSHGPDWTNDTTRSAGTALVRVNGIWLNNASITNGPAALRGTYVGTTRSNASSTLDWIFGGTASGGLAGNLAVWNCYNRVEVASTTIDSVASIIVNLAAQVVGNGDQCSFICGLAEDAFFADSVVNGAAGTGGTFMVGIGIDATVFSGIGGRTGNNTFSLPMTSVIHLTTIGYHFFRMVVGAITANAIVYGTGTAAEYTTGIRVMGRM